MELSILKEDGTPLTPKTVFTIPVLLPAQSYVVTTSWAMSETDVYYNIIANINPARISGVELDLNNNQVEQKLPAISLDELQISKSGPALADSGAAIAYTVTITNNSVATLTGVVITDRIPLGAVYVSGGTKEEDVVKWTVPTLAANGGVIKSSFVVTATDTIANSDYHFYADGGVHLSSSKPIVTVITGGTPPLGISKAAPAITIPGAPVTYTLTVANSSPISLTNFLITDTLPAGASYITGGVKTGNVISWTLSALPPGGQMQVGFVVTTSTSLTNSNYRVSAEGGVLSAVGNEAIVTTIGGETPIDPAQGGSVLITDTLNAGVTQRLTIEIPSKAVSEAMTLAYASVPPPDSWLASPVLGFTDLVFHLQAFDGMTALPNLSLLLPMTVTLHYTAADDVDRLGVYYFDQDRQQWIPASATCFGSGSLQLPPDAERKIIQATACRFGEFALLQELYPMYMPLIFR